MCGCNHQALPPVFRAKILYSLRICLTRLFMCVRLCVCLCVYRSCFCPRITMSLCHPHSGLTNEKLCQTPPESWCVAAESLLAFAFRPDTSTFLSFQCSSILDFFYQGTNVGCYSTIGNDLEPTTSSSLSFTG